MGNTLKYLAVSGLAIFSLFGWTTLSLHAIGAGLLTLFVLARPISFIKALFADSLGWWIVAGLFYLVAHFLFIASLAPLDNVPSYAAFQDWAVLWLFPIVAWAVKGRTADFVRVLFGLAATGLLVSVAFLVEWSELSEFFRYRQEYQFASVPMGLYSGIVIFGLLMFSDVVFHGDGNIGRWIKGWRVMIWCVAFALALGAFVSTQSRGSWLAFIVAIVMSAALLLFLRRSGVVAAIRRHRLTVAVALLMILSFSWLMHGVVGKRLAAEADVYEALVSFDREEIPYTSVGRRFHMWIYGIQEWIDRPLFGWGSGSARTLLQLEPELSRHPHFHNAYLQIAIELGVVGLAVFGVVVMLLIGRLVDRFRKKEVPLDIFVFLGGSWAMVFTWGLIDTRFSQSDGRFLLLMLLGATMAFGRGWVRPDRSRA